MRCRTRIASPQAPDVNPGLRSERLRSKGGWEAPALTCGAWGFAAGWKVRWAAMTTPPTTSPTTLDDLQVLLSRKDPAAIADEFEGMDERRKGVGSRFRGMG